MFSEHYLKKGGSPNKNKNKKMYMNISQLMKSADGANIQYFSSIPAFFQRRLFANKNNYNKHIRKLSVEMKTAGDADF